MRKHTYFKKEKLHPSGFISICITMTLLLAQPKSFFKSLTVQPVDACLIYTATTMQGMQQIF